ncbi:bile acid:sodium symporter family protein [Ruania alba]|uniref:Solute carrier family 10 (Sodium/bile acid cotransporter), member 7 n=1 Tax=Ruania alba TaxID=648782 RepID=A0A1H5MHH0_9MICO|nr:bile acid:sodium symporter family protein [Ruania alba]SEE88829.1 solute carrier family 10 (sodium/bile acid cotransporter), member 7 [Ruania alba]
MKRVIRGLDPFVLLILGALVLGLVLPISEPVLDGVGRVGDVAIFLLFLVYGMRLRTTEVLGSLRNWRLQGGILAATYLIFPALGLLISWAVAPIVGAALAAGVLYLSLLPSTVQASVAFVSVARGNVAGAISAATISNVVGMVATPLLVLWLMGSSGATGMGGIRSVLLQLLLPFVIGQVLQPWVGDWVRSHKPLTTVLDRGTVILLVFAAVASATADGVWQEVSAVMLVALLGVSGLLLTVLLLITWWGGKGLGLDVADRIALLMCGSKKSLATGLPMALVLFPAAAAATIAVPVIIFHQLQLVVCAAIARRLAAR